MDPWEDLRKEIADHRAVIVVGAEVSIHATGNAKCASWTGLLHNGADYCAGLNPKLKSDWLGRVRGEIDSDDMDDLLSAAYKITAKLGGSTGGEYSNWLKRSVGSLQLKNGGLIGAIRDLGVPIATTNYDGLLERVTGLEAVT